MMLDINSLKIHLDNAGSSSASAFAMAVPPAITSAMAAAITAPMSSAIPEN